MHKTVRGRPSQVPDLKSAGGRVKWLRERGGMKQLELALAMGYTHQSGIGNVERRNTVPPLLALHLAKFFSERLDRSITPEWIISGGVLPRVPVDQDAVLLHCALALLEPLLQGERKPLASSLSAWVIKPTDVEARKIAQLIANSSKSERAISGRTIAAANALLVAIRRSQKAHDATKPKDERIDRVGNRRAATKTSGR